MIKRRHELPQGISAGKGNAGRVRMRAGDETGNGHGKQALPRIRSASKARRLPKEPDNAIRVKPHRISGGRHVALANQQQGGRSYRPKGPATPSLLRAKQPGTVGPGQLEKGQTYAQKRPAKPRSRTTEAGRAVLTVFHSPVKVIIFPTSSSVVCYTVVRRGLMSRQSALGLKLKVHQN